MKFYGTIINDITEVQSALDQAETGMLVADKQMFAESINKLEKIIIKIKDKTNAENNI